MSCDDQVHVTVLGVTLPPDLDVSGIHEPLGLNFAALVKNEGEPHLEGFFPMRDKRHYHSNTSVTGIMVAKSYHPSPNERLRKIDPDDQGVFIDCSGTVYMARLSDPHKRMEILNKIDVRRPISETNS